MRAIAFDESFEPLREGLARKPISVRHDQCGAAEVDADEYVDAAAACIDELQRRGCLSGVTAVVMSSQWHSIVAVGPDRRPRTGVLTWADTRPTTTKARVPADVDAFHERTGTWLHALYWTTRIPWLAAAVSGSGSRFLGLSEYVQLRLLGDDSISLSMASGTGLLDLGNGLWDQEALAIAGITEDALPTLVASGWRGYLTSSARRRWPELAAAPWLPVVGDGAASNIGAGCTDPRRIAVTIGTSAAVRIVHRDGSRGLPHRLWRYRVDDFRYVTGSASSAGGNVHAWARTVLRDVNEAALADIAPGTTETVALPFLMGARPPENLAAGHGVLAGLGPGTTAAAIVASLFEAVCFEVARGVQALESALESSGEIVLNGGAVVASPWWQRALAATFGRPVRVCTDRDMAARGAALLARHATIEPRLEDVIPTDADVERMTRSRVRYEAIRDSFGFPPL